MNMHVLTDEEPHEEAHPIRTGKRYHEHEANRSAADREIGHAWT